MKIARAERFYAASKWSDQNRTDFVPLHALRGSAPIRYAIVDGMTHPAGRVGKLGRLELHPLSRKALLTKVEMLGAGPIDF